LLLSFVILLGLIFRSRWFQERDVLLGEESTQMIEEGAQIVPLDHSTTARVWLCKSRSSVHPTPK